MYTYEGQCERFVSQNRTTAGRRSAIASMLMFPSNLSAHLARINEHRFSRENWDPYLSPAHSADAYLS